MRNQAIVVTASLTATLTTAVSSAFAQDSPVSFALPKQEDRVAIFSRLVSEIERLDGDALAVRATKGGQSWRSVTNQLAREAAAATSLADFSRVFSRLDGTYPNLHSYFEPGDALATVQPKRIRMAAQFEAEVFSPNHTEFKIIDVDADLSVLPEDQPREGDRLAAINGRRIEDWRGENFTFCKFPLKFQCDQELAWNFAQEMLSWRRYMPLIYTLERSGRRWDVPVPFRERPSQTPANPRRLECGATPDRYPQFTATYTGNRACVFESPAHPGTAILRITSFSYRKLPESAKIRSVQDEVATLLPWWQSHASWDHLIIDVIDNGGGQAPIDYYRILLTEPFQEQYAQLRKGPELEDTDLRKGILWDSAEHELWFQDLRANGTYDAIPAGAFLPPIPQFCALEGRSCAEGEFIPFEHPFRGRVTLLVNQRCVSSCDGFVWQLKERLKSKVHLVGQPQAADPAWSRLVIDVIPDKGKEGALTTGLRPLYSEPPADRILSQTVYISQSTDKAGLVIDGKPIPVDLFIPTTFANWNTWHHDALAGALTLKQ